MSASRDRLVATLNRARGFLFRRALEQAGLAAVVGLIAVALVAFWLALAAPLHRGEYAALRIALLVAGAAFLLAALARMLRARARLKDAALAAGRLLGERDDELLTALELTEDGREAGYYSDALREAAVRSAADRAATAPIARLRLWNARGKWFAAAGVAAALAAITAVAGGSRTSVVLRHIADPRTAPAVPVVIRVEPGSIEIEGGESVPVRAFVRGTSRRPTLSIEEPGGWRDLPLDAADDLAGARAGERAYFVALRNVKEDVRYRVEAGGATSPVFALTVRDLPRATGYRIRYDYPPYTGLKAEEGSAVTGDLAAPRGTRAHIAVTLSRSVERAEIRAEGGGPPVRGALGERLARFDLPVRSDGRYSIHLLDARGRRVDLGPFDVRAIPDRPPTVTVLSPGPVEDLTRDMTAEVIAGATDDYGVRAIRIRYKAREEAEREETLHEEKGVTRELAIRYTWALGPMNLLPGEEVEYRIGATDGDQVDGPQTTWSEARTLRFPSAAEILSSLSDERDESINTLEDVLKSAKELSKKSEDLSRDLGRSQEMTWEKRQEAQKTLEGQQAMRDKIDKIAQKLGQDADKLSQSRALNAELVQKIQELQQILSQIKDQDLRRSIEQLQQAMKKLSPEEMQRALENLKLNQDLVMKNLERTIEMLKQIRTEEKLEAASERAAEMERRQIALNDSLSRAKRQDDIKELAANQRQVEAMSQEERAALDSLATQLQAMDRQAAQESQRLAGQLGEEGALPDFHGAEQGLEQANRDQAGEHTKSLKERLAALRKSVDEMREGFKNRKKNDIAEKMETAAKDLIEIGKLQENTLDDPTSSLNDRAETQKGLQDATSAATRRLGDLAKQTLFLTPDIGQALGRALANQDNAVGRYSQQDLAGGLLSGKEAAIGLNQAAAGVLRSRDSMQGSKSSTGFQEAMERLQGLAGQQQSLNDQSMNMMPGGEGGDQTQGQGGQRLTEGQGDALARMAAEQEAIRRGLEETMNQIGKGGGTLGNLGDVANDMKRVEQDLRGGRLDQETTERQQRILSRLLDAPRAVEKRDYSRRRTSRPGVDVVRSSPGALSPDLLQSRPSIAALLARAGRDPVSPRYRAIVDEYLQSVLEGKAR
ncbi:MAG TPA: hypothetical protein VF363_02455 [Candidatus Eisenbacteria bacterium]